MTRTHRLLASLSDDYLRRLAFRLLDKADIPRTPTGEYDRTKPWIWKGDTDRDGYGRIKVKGRKVAAHRVAFFLAHGYVPGTVRHTAPGLPSDVNPYRLLPGDGKNRLNMQDRSRDGNDPVGVRNGRSKLNAQKVRDIRLAVARGDRQARVARDYGVDATTVRDVVRRRTWSHVR